MTDIINTPKADKLLPSIEALSLGYTDPPVQCTPQRWHEAFGDYERKARGHAANLAAHNWDVLLVDGRIFLFQTRYGGERGHWLNRDCSRHDATAEEQAALYTPTHRRRAIVRASTEAAHDRG